MEFNIIDSFRIIKVVQSSHHKVNARYGSSREIQYNVHLYQLAGHFLNCHTFDN